MTARIAGFHSRADLGLRAPRSISRQIRPSRGGTAIHYGGNPVRKRSHQDCIDTWRAWQSFHMRPVSQGGRGWTDIAYTGGFCDHGFIMAGRGAGIRTGANGTNYGNDFFYAVTWIGGDGQTSTPQAIDALEWWIAELRRAGGAAERVVPHRFFKSTGCPGNPLAAQAARLDRAPISTTPPPPAPAPPTPMEDMMYVELILAAYRRARGPKCDPRVEDPSGWRHWMESLAKAADANQPLLPIVRSCEAGLASEGK